MEAEHWRGREHDQKRERSCHLRVSSVLLRDGERRPGVGAYWHRQTWAPHGKAQFLPGLGKRCSVSEGPTRLLSFPLVPRRGRSSQAVAMEAWAPVGRTKSPIIWDAIERIGESDWLYWILPFASLDHGERSGWQVGGGVVAAGTRIHSRLCQQRLPPCQHTLARMRGRYLL